MLRRWSHPQQIYREGLARQHGSPLLRISTVASIVFYRVTLREIGLESTVVDCTSEVPLVLRSGSISLEQLREVIPATVVYETPDTEVPRSPGLRHKHYSPRARIILVADVRELGETQAAGFIGLSRPAAKFEREYICSTVEDYAHSIFEFFRECDRAGVQTIYCERVEEQGIGVALMDRLRRAAEE